MAMMLTRLEWIRRLRRQAATVVVCTTALVVALLASTTLPWLATTGVAVAGVALVAGMVHKALFESETDA